MGDIINLKTERKKRQAAAEGWELATDCSITVTKEDSSVILTLDTPDYTVALALPPGFAQKLSRLLFSAAASHLEGR